MPLGMGAHAHRSFRRYRRNRGPRCHPSARLLPLPDPLMPVGRSYLIPERPRNHPPMPLVGSEHVMHAAQRPPRATHHLIDMGLG